MIHHAFRALGVPGTTRTTLLRFQPGGWEFLRLPDGREFAIHPVSGWMTPGNSAWAETWAQTPARA